MIERKILLENLLRLRSRVEDWTQVHGWDNMDNHTVRKNKDGSIVWKVTDWEFIDNMYGSVYNGKNGFGNDNSFNKDTIRTWNRMWKRYKNNNDWKLDAEWAQLQQMGGDWAE